MEPSTFRDEGLDAAFRAYRPELVRLAAFITGDRAAGEDVVQDVFVRIHQRWDRLAVSEPLPYLRTADNRRRRRGR